MMKFKFKTLSLVICTLLWLLKFKNFHFISYLREHYDDEAVRIYKKLISETRKLEKDQSDLSSFVGYHICGNFLDSWTEECRDSLKIPTV